MVNCWLKLSKAQGMGRYLPIYGMYSSNSNVTTVYVQDTQVLQLNSLLFAQIPSHSSSLVGNCSQRTHCEANWVALGRTRQFNWAFNIITKTTERRDKIEVYVLLKLISQPYVWCDNAVISTDTSTLKSWQQRAWRGQLPWKQFSQIPQLTLHSMVVESVKTKLVDFNCFIHC